MSRNATMRIAILSDLHGNLLALEAVLADLTRRGPFDQIVVAGDLAWSGPWPAEVVDRVRALNAVVIQGNTDAFFCQAAGNLLTGKQEERFVAHLAWMRERLGPERVRYLASLPFSHRVSPALGEDLLVVHANPVDHDRPIPPQISDAELDGLLLCAGHEPDWRALAFGHLHIPFIRRWRGRLLVNVASVGLPLDGDPRAAYAILTWNGVTWQAEHYRVDYEVPVVAYHMRHSGMPSGAHFAERLMAARSGPIVPAGVLMIQ